MSPLEQAMIAAGLDHDDWPVFTPRVIRHGERPDVLRILPAEAVVDAEDIESERRDVRAEERWRRREQA